MTKLNGWKIGWVVFVLCAATAIAARAQTFKTLANFDGTNGAAPYYDSTPVQGRDGNLYGTTSKGGAYNSGTVFRIDPRGVLTTLHSFCPQGFPCTDGATPYAGLVLGLDGNFYGTTVYGGNGNFGSIFKITPTGSLTSLFSFDGNDGQNPFATLVQGIDGDFYGTTFVGPGGGTAFKISAEGKFSLVHTFCNLGKCGTNPVAAMIQGTDGNFYGTTAYGGASNTCAFGCGTVFKMTPNGTLTTLYSFCAQDSCADGATPYGGLVQATDGDFYGTTTYGGSNCPGFGCGTVFKITKVGKLTTLYNFCTQPSCADGSLPWGTLVQATDGNFYGTTYSSNQAGTVFEITAAGQLTTLHSFRAVDGGEPLAGLAQGTDGSFYGTTSAFGSGGQGTVFSLSVGLAPFVTFVRAAGKVGQTGPVLGQGFTGTTRVSINGILADFTVISDTDIRATVPVGATTGYVTVTTPHGVLKSNVPFHVIQ